MMGVVHTAWGWLRNLWLLVYVWLGNKMMALFPNSDDPLPPDQAKFRAALEDFYGKHIVLVTWKEARAWWWWRNPFHDLLHYGIGIADESFESYPSSSFWNPDGGWFFSHHVLDRAVPWYVPRKFPWASYQSKRVEFYAGWRPTGAFGFALRRA